MDFPINFPQHGKMQQNPLYGESLGNWYSYFSHGMGVFFPYRMGAFFPIRFPSYGIVHDIGSEWVFSSISHSIGKDSETHQMRKAWEIGSHIFSIIWVLFSIRLPSCGILHHMGNAWVLSSVSHSMRKGRKTYWMGEA